MEDFNRHLAQGLAIVLSLLGVLMGMTAIGRAAGLNWLAPLFVLLAWFPSVLAHELGHAIAAWICGWRVWMVHVAPLAWRSHPHSLQLVGYLRGREMGGFVVCHPPSENNDTRARTMLISAGGPIASWAFGFALAVVAAAWPASPYAMRESPLPGVLGGLAFISFSVAVLSTWPYWKNARPANDAAMLIAKARDRRSPLSEQAAGVGYQLWGYGVPSRFWDPWIRRTDDGQPLISGAYLDFLRALESNDPEQAKAVLARIGVHKAHGEADYFKVLKAFAAVRWDNDASTAESLLSSKILPPQEPRDIVWLRDMAIAGVQYLNGDGDYGRERLARLRRKIASQAPLSPSVWTPIISSAEAQWRSAAPAPHIS